MGDPGLTLVSGRSPGKGNGNPPQPSCLENYMDKGAWWATVHEIAKSWTWLSNDHFHYYKSTKCLKEHTSIYEVKLLSSVQFSSVAQSCLTLCDPMNHSMPGLPGHHQLPEFTQTHVHRVSDAIQPSHSVVPFSSCPQSLPASESFPVSQLFAWGGQSVNYSRVYMSIPNSLTIFFPTLPGNHEFIL